MCRPSATNPRFHVLTRSPVAGTAILEQPWAEGRAVLRSRRGRCRLGLRSPRAPPRPPGGRALGHGGARHWRQRLHAGQRPFTVAAHAVGMARARRAWRLSRGAMVDRGDTRWKQGKLRCCVSPWPWPGPWARPASGPRSPCRAPPGQWHPSTSTTRPGGPGSRSWRSLRAASPHQAASTGRRCVLPPRGRSCPSRCGRDARTGKPPWLRRCWPPAPRICSCFRALYRPERGCGWTW